MTGKRAPLFQIGSESQRRELRACEAKKEPEDALPAVKMKSANLSRAPGSLMTLQIAANFAVSANRYTAERAHAAPRLCILPMKSFLCVKLLSVPLLWTSQPPFVCCRRPCDSMVLLCHFFTH
jgi:hypothetical protein